MKKLINILFLCGLLATVFTLTACTQIPQKTARVQIVASFYPLAEFARQIAGQNANVITIVPAGAEPHDYEPTPKDISIIKSADIFIYNGGNIDGWVEKVKNGDQNSNSFIEIGKSFKSQDPHIWLNFEYAATEVEIIRDALIQADPEKSAEYKTNAANYIEKLSALEQKFQTTLQNCERKEFVTTHAAFGLLAQEYGLTQIPILGLSPDSEPSAKQLGEIATLAKEKNITHIYFETLVSPKLAETVAAEIGAQTLVLNPIEGLTEKEIAEGKSYLSVMEENLTNLATGLHCASQV